MSKVLNYDGLNTHTVSAGPDALVRLVPGRNVIDDEVFKKLTDKKKGSEGFCCLMEEGIVTVLDGKAVGTESGEVLMNMLKGKEAASIIEGELDLEVLNKYKAQEEGNGNRVSIIKQIDAQLEKLDTENKASDDENSD